MWAITTSQGIILLDAIYDYSIEDEVDEGLKKLGLESGGHQIRDRQPRSPRSCRRREASAGQFGARLIMSAADYDLLDQQNPTWKPKRDMVATDGMKLTLGDTTLTLYLTPGHTQGTISTLIPLRDGTRETSGRSVGRDDLQLRPDPAAAGDVCRVGGALPRHRDHRRMPTCSVESHPVRRWQAKLPAVAARKPGQPNPYVVGNDVVDGI